MKTSLIVAVSLAALLLSLLLSVSYGAGAYNLLDFIAYFREPRAASADIEVLDILLQTRLPRTLGAVIVGAGLSLAATLLQTVTRNPLAEPGLLGINAGAVLGMTIGLSYFSAASAEEFMLWSGGGALAAAAGVVSVAVFSKHANPPHLILIGIAMSATLGGLANYIMMSFATTLEQFRFWNLGSLAAIKLKVVGHILPYMAVAFIATFFLARPLAVMQLGEDKAKTMGVPVAAVTFGVWIVAAVLTAVAVSIAGPIMFAGFLAAYLARLAIGPRLGLQLFCSAVFGTVLVLLADTSARWVIRPYEVPVGVIIALLGTPLTIAAAKSRFFRSALVRQA